eukprot:CAMPEP_0115378450 /NCGR_PEP_ID=MMETSP0271-20121206/4021_1 /TAXON_ID=71861 /ORGANISM="Scrippsiella trochoidea, Strain CCMP3099" /LENGTH=560 /DNA_ID=CAMNT_0002801619 /DNA_START=84 /DNA_END=1763 /DNA_ORIENTATION=-
MTPYLGASASALFVFYVGAFETVPFNGETCDAYNDSSGGCRSHDSADVDPSSMLQTRVKQQPLSAEDEEATTTLSSTTTESSTTLAPNECAETLPARVICVSLSDVTGPQHALLVVDALAETAADKIDAKVLSYYQQLNLVTAADELSTLISWQGMEVSNRDLAGMLTNLDKQGQTLGAYAKIHIEQGKDTDLVKYNRNLGVPADGYKTINNNEQAEGISSMSQLSTANADQLVQGLPADVQKSVELQKKLEDQVTAIQADTEATATKKATEIQDALDTFSIEYQDLNTEMQKGQDQIDSLMKLQGGTADEIVGETLEVGSLLNQLGVFRGCVISGTYPQDSSAQTVVKLAGAYQTNGVEQYKHSILTKSDQLDYEVDMSFSSSNAASSGQKIMSSIGGIGGGAESTSSSSASTSSESKNQEAKNQEKVADFYKMRYAIAPLFGLHVDEEFMQPTMAVAKDLELLKELCDPDCKGSSVYDNSKENCKRLIVNLFNKYGTHVCPVVTVGGFFMTKAEVHSLSAMSAVEMDNIASAAPFVAGSASVGHASSDSSYDAGGDKT